VRESQSPQVTTDRDVENRGGPKSRIRKPENRSLGAVLGEAQPEAQPEASWNLSWYPSRSLSWSLSWSLSRNPSWSLPTLARYAVALGAVRAERPVVVEARRIDPGRDAMPPTRSRSLRTRGMRTRYAPSAANTTSAPHTKAIAYRNYESNYFHSVHHERPASPPGETVASPGSPCVSGGDRSGQPLISRTSGSPTVTERVALSSVLACSRSTSCTQRFGSP